MKKDAKTVNSWHFFNISHVSIASFICNRLQNSVTDKAIAAKSEPD
jgi:hypothetical protein